MLPFCFLTNQKKQFWAGDKQIVKRLYQVIEINSSTLSENNSCALNSIFH